MNPSFSAQKHKIVQLAEWVQSSKRRVPFFTLTETHLNSLIFDAEVEVEGYNIHRADRILRKQGGVAVYTRADLAVSDHQIFSSSFCEASMVFIESANIIVVGVYRPPASFSHPDRCCPPEHFTNCCEAVRNFCALYATATVVVSGDFNLPFVDWNTDSIFPGRNVLASERSAAESVFRLMDDLFLEQIVDEPTRAGKNILDLVFVNSGDLIHDIRVTKTMLSDHDLISYTLRSGEVPGIDGILPRDSPSNSFVPMTIFDRINIHKTNWEFVKEDLLEVDWTPVTSAPSQELAWKFFSDIVAHICAKHAPEHKRPRKKPKIPRDRQVLLRKKRRVMSRVHAVKEKNPDDSGLLDSLYSKLGSIELEMGSSIANQRNHEEIQILKKMKSQPKAFYSYSNRKKASSCNIGPLHDRNGTLQADPSMMAEILQSQYTGVFSPPENDHLMTDHTDAPISNCLTDIEFSSERVLAAIKDISSSSAPGPDKFPSIVLKECGAQLAPVMATLWRLSMETGDIAPLFKQQTIVPVFKKGSRATPANYRPVSLTSHLAKVAERVIRSQMSDFVEKSGFFTHDQHGSRSGYSCFTQLAQHLDDVLHDLEQGHNVDVLYLDLSKAYDRVSHKRLLQKLEHCGIGGSLLAWLECFLSNRTQVVVVNGCHSSPARVLSGVPQGTVLAALLFLIYINDLPTVAHHSMVKMFVDDSKVHKTISTEDDRALLLQDMKRIEEWAEVNSMKFNAEKF